LGYISVAESTGIYQPLLRSAARSYKIRWNNAK